MPRDLEPQRAAVERAGGREAARRAGCIHDEGAAHRIGYCAAEGRWRFSERFGRVIRRGIPVAEANTDASLPSRGRVRGRGNATCGIFAAPKRGLVDFDRRGGVARKRCKVAAQEETERRTLRGAERGVGVEIEVAHPNAAGRVDPLAVMAPSETPHAGPALARRERAHDEARRRAELARGGPVPLRHAEGFADEAAPGKGGDTIATEQRIGAGMGRGKPPRLAEEEGVVDIAVIVDVVE